MENLDRVLACGKLRYYYVTMPQQGQGQYPQDGQMQGQAMQQPNFVDQSQMQNLGLPVGSFSLFVV